MVAEHGLQYLLAGTILTGLFQILFGYFKIARYMKFIPRAVMVHDIDIVVIGSRGLNRLQEFVLGSVSHKVAKHAKCPVLVVK